MNDKHVLGQNFDLFQARYTGPRNAGACVRAYLKNLERESQFELKRYAGEHWEDLMKLYGATDMVVQHATQVLYEPDPNVPQVD